MWWLLIPAIVALAVLLVWARQRQQAVFWNRVVAGLFAGSLATLAYDVVRVPIAWSGVPVFKAISYFGCRDAKQCVGHVLAWFDEWYDKQG